MCVASTNPRSILLSVLYFVFVSMLEKKHIAEHTDVDGAIL